MKNSEVVSSLKLPTKPVLEGASMQDIIFFLYGPPGIGKSTFVSQAPDTLFLSTDPGLRFIKSMHLPVSSWLGFKKIVSKLVVERPKAYKGICIDTIDLLLMMCQKYVCEKRNIEHQSDEPFGKAYEITRSHFMTELLKLKGLDYTLFFISHSRTEEERGRAVRTSKVKPTLPSQGYKVLSPMCDIIAYYGFDEEAADDKEAPRRMFFQLTETMEAKDRSGLLPNSLTIPKRGGFELVESYILGKSFREDDEGEPPVRHKKKIIIRKK